MVSGSGWKFWGAGFQERDSRLEFERRDSRIRKCYSQIRDILELLFSNSRHSRIENAILEFEAVSGPNLFSYQVSGPDLVSSSREFSARRAREDELECPARMLR